MTVLTSRQLLQNFAVNSVDELGLAIVRMMGSDRYGVRPSRSAASRPAIGGEGILTSTGVDVVKLTLRDEESAQEAVRRFRKLVERSGIKKEMRVREFYEKPSETKRRARLRAQRRARRERFFATH